MFKINVDVRTTYSGFYIDVVPKYARPGQTISVNAYMIDSGLGGTVTYDLFENGAKINSRSKSSKLIYFYIYEDFFDLYFKNFIL